MIYIKLEVFKTSRSMRVERIVDKEVSCSFKSGHSESLINEFSLVRDKSRELCELLSNADLLQNEREFARQTRDKLMGTVGSQ